jgi:type III secretory pathway component EscV
MVMKSIFARNSDAALAIFVVAVAAMLLIPLPTSLLDLLLAINLSFSLLLLLVGLYIPNALALLAFPALLLLTTLFRLSLNVASTRLILSNGYAGEVIQSFGDFLIAGDPVIGGVIFTIITIVNFIVITRGAGRVSEVSARFALDALPGKQMAIDADLRAGIISAEEACRKREDLRKESQLYGAMDGAMKFVQGDAIAGIFIIFTNILGGLYVGVLRGEMSFSEAVSTYTVLTVGDGLVSQVPALLISICAGIVVTYRNFFRVHS